MNAARGFEEELTLVLPDEADAEQDEISIMSPMGFALIGRRVGDSTTWSTCPNRASRLTVTAVSNANVRKSEDHH